jgi:hypothetical protein
MATHAVCNAIDSLRRDTLALISLHNSIAKKEKELGNIRNGLDKAATKTHQRG